MNDKFGTAVNEASTSLWSLLTVYSEKMRRAYLIAGDEAFKVNLGISFKAEGDQIEIETSISFTESKIKDSARKLISDQTPLPLELVLFPPPDIPRARRNKGNCSLEKCGAEPILNGYCAKHMPAYKEAEYEGK